MADNILICGCHICDKDGTDTILKLASTGTGEFDESGSLVEHLLDATKVNQSAIRCLCQAANMDRLPLEDIGDFVVRKGNVNPEADFDITLVRLLGPKSVRSILSNCSPRYSHRCHYFHRHSQFREIFQSRQQFCSERWILA